MISTAIQMHFSRKLKQNKLALTSIVGALSEKSLFFRVLLSVKYYSIMSFIDI